MMPDYKAEILRLNEKIKELMWRIEQSMSRNSQLDHENKRLSLKVEEMKEICAKTSSTNVFYKMQLDGEKQMKEELFIGNAKLKKKVNELATQCYEQHEKIRVLESNLRRSTSASTSRSSSRVTIIGNVSQIIQKVDPKTSSEYLVLEARYGELEKEYEQAMAIIDELEFELDDIDYLEIEIHRLREENAKLKEKLQQTSEGDKDYYVVSPPVAAFAFTAASEETNEADNTDDTSTKENVQDVVQTLMTINKRKKMMQQKLDELRAARQ